MVFRSNPSAMCAASEVENRYYFIMQLFSNYVFIISFNWTKTTKIIYEPGMNVWKEAFGNVIVMFMKLVWFVDLCFYHALLVLFQVDWRYVLNGNIHVKTVLCTTKGQSTRAENLHRSYASICYPVAVAWCPW